MTQASYTNYVANMMYYNALLADKVVKAYKYDLCTKYDLRRDYLLSSMYIELLRCWELYDDDATTSSVEATGVQVLDPYGDQAIELTTTNLNTLDLSVGSVVDLENLFSGEIVTNVEVLSIDIQLGGTYYVYLDDYTVYGGRNVTITKTINPDNPNCVEVADMKKITYNLNRIFGTSYCVDYVLD